MDMRKLPREIFSGHYDTGHCQGIAVDVEKGYIYYSFTTCLVKSDLEGRVIGSVNGLIGHLGCIDFYRGNGCVYGSLEYKNDEIGKGILNLLGRKDDIANAFYCAVFDVDKIDRMNMDACEDGVMKCAYLKDVVEDYCAVEGGVAHRFGCSGIDGTAIGPAFGAKAGAKDALLIAYGIYGDVNREDNDDQIILGYDPDEIAAVARPLRQEAMHRSGPQNPGARYAARTGNTTYGVQNLEYDPTTGDYLAAVYVGHKPAFCNRPLYILDGHEEREGRIRVKAASDFPYGQTGVSALGEGLYYFSEDGRDEAGWYTRVRLYRGDGARFWRE